MRKKEFIPMNLQLFAEPPAGGDGDAGDTSATGGKSGEGSNKADPDDEGDDGVSLAEQVAQLKVQNAKLKKANDKATSEAASYKKQLREKQTAEEIALQEKDYELTYIWGFDQKEKNRAERTIEANPQANHEFPLLDRQLSKEEVHGLFERTFDFARPKMYELGYPNNNCIGCIKGGMGYWNNIRKDFPEIFESRAKLERDVGYSILKDSNSKPIFLDELDPNRGNMNTEIFPDCGIMCYLAESE